MTALSLALVIPWAAGVVLLLLDGRRPLVGWLAVAALAGNLAALVVLAADVLADGPVGQTTGGWPAGVGITLRADALGVLFAVLSAVAVLAATVFEVLDGVRARVFPGMVVLLAAGLTGVFVTGDLFNFYVFFELAMTARGASSAPRSCSRRSTCSARSCSCCRSRASTTSRGRSTWR
jgi:multicomponent Na+:H+ antiporter subunit D